MKKIALVGILLTSLLLVGCLDLIEDALTDLEASLKEPDELYEETIEKFGDQEKLKLEYNLDIKMGSSSISYPSSGLSNMSLDYSKLGEKEKWIMSAGPTTVAAYVIDGKTVTCTEYSYSYSPSSQNNIRCQVREEEDEYGYYGSSSIEQFKKLMDLEIDLDESEYFTLEYKDVKTISDRKCYDFLFRIEPEYFEEEGFLGSSSLGYSSGFSDFEGNITYETCLDKEFGFPVINELKLTKYSVLSGEEEDVMSYSLTLEEFSQDVKEKDLKVPVPVVIQHVICDTDNKEVRAEVVSLTGEDQTITLNLTQGYSYYGTGQEIIEQQEKTLTGLEVGEKTFVTFYISEELPTGSSYVEVCVDDYCDTGNCYNYDYGNGYDGGYGITDLEDYPTDEPGGLKGNYSEYNFVEYDETKEEYFWKSTRSPNNPITYLEFPSQSINNSNPEVSFKWELNYTDFEAFPGRAMFGVKGEEGKEVMLYYNWDTDKSDEIAVKGRFRKNEYSKASETDFINIEEGQEYNVSIWVENQTGYLSVNGQEETVELISNYTDTYEKFYFWLGRGTDHWDTYSQASGYVRDIKLEA